MRTRYSRASEEDLYRIARYTLEHWGEERTRRYVHTVIACCELLASHPNLGPRCSNLSPGLRRIRQHRHIIFYRVFENEIFISRILHQAALASSQPFPASD